MAGAYSADLRERVLAAASVRNTATEIRIVADGALIANHARRFGRDQLICDPWHHLPILERKPGALRNGAPFLDWEPPFSLCATTSSSSPRGTGPSSSCS